MNTGEGKKEISFGGRILVVEPEQISPEEFMLVGAAREAMKNAWAKYSGFRVGCAVLLEGGIMIGGSNQEDAVFPLGLCAERVALFTAAHNHPGIPIVAMAIVSSAEVSGDQMPAFPCGSCRQVMAGFGHRQGRPIRLYVACQHGGSVFVAEDMAALLPFAFTDDHLG